MRATRGLWILGVCPLLWALVACDANFTVTDIKRRLEQIGGTSSCDARVAEGSKGAHTLRIFLIDDHPELPQAIDPGVLKKAPFTMKSTDFSIGSGSGHEPQVLDARDGTPAAGVTVELQVDPSLDAFQTHPNPRYQSLLGSIGNKRVPKAVMLLMDMSDKAADVDSRRLRLSAAGLWILQNFNADSTVGDLDILSVLLMRQGEVTSTDVLFKTYDPDKQFLAFDGRRRGFILATKGEKETMSSGITGMSSSASSGTLPLYAGIQAAASDLRTVATDGDTGEELFNPALISLSIGVDHSLTDQKDDLHKEALSALAGEGGKDAVPLMSVTYPRPDGVSDEQWQKHQTQLCQLIRSHGEANGDQGQHFAVAPNPNREAFQASILSHLNLAYHASRGYSSLRISYQLNGGQKGKRYLVSFKLQGKLLDGQSDLENSPRIVFEVRP